MEKESFFPVITAALARVGRGEILRRFGPKSCIASTRIVIDVLERYGIASNPMAARTVVTRSDDGVTLGSVDGTIGKPPEWNGTVAGHLIVVLPGHGLLIDASLDQVRNQEFDIDNLPCPFIAPVGAEFIAGGESAYFCLAGCGIIYEPHAIPDAVLATREWRQRQPRAGVVDKICAHIDRAKPISGNQFRKLYPSAHEFCESTNVGAADS
jgi:hypothetical protein